MVVKTLGQAISVSVIWGVLCGFAMWFLADELASIGELSSQATEFCIQYVRVFAISMPFFGVVMVGAMCMHGAGETVRPFVISVAINIVNVSLSWMLCGADIDFGDSVLVNPFSFDLDVLGIALGSVFGIFIGAVLTLLILLRGIKDLKLKPTSLLPSPAMAWRVIKIGIPNFLEGMAMWTANIFVLGFIGTSPERPSVCRHGLRRPGIHRSGRRRRGLQGAHIIAVGVLQFPSGSRSASRRSLAGQYLGAGNRHDRRRCGYVSPSGWR